MPLAAPQPSSRARHVGLALAIAPGLLTSRRQRLLFQEMRRFIMLLPAAMQNPLPAALAQLTPDDRQPTGLEEKQVRHLADVVALLARRSPLGLCLRRSLLRYHYLRRGGVPVVICFGARLAVGENERKVAGHAWTTLDNQPYYEEDANWQNFAVMFRWPS